LKVRIGKKYESAYVDSLSSLSHISLEFAKALRLDIHKCVRKITLGDSSITSTIGYTHLVFKLAGKAIKHTFHILNTPPFNLILGLDFIKKYHLVPDFTAGKFWFTFGRGMFEEEIENAATICALHGLNNSQETDLETLIAKFPELFSDKLGKTHLVECKLDPKDPTPIAQKPYPISNLKRELISKNVEEMLKLGVIEPSDSEWASPVYMHTKDNGKNWRFTLDARKLNSTLKRDPFPIPRLDYLFNNLGSAKFMTVIDLKKGFWQVPMEEESKKYTAFICHEGKFQFKRMFFGLVSAPSLFQRLVNKILGRARGLFADAYIDDIIIYSKTWKEHLEHLKYVFEQIQKAGMTVNKEKCNFGKTTLKYLGFVISPYGIQTDPDKTRPIRDFPRPQTVRQLRRFLGICGWYRQFIHNYADKCEPLNALLKNSVKYYWSERQEKAFLQLKNDICSNDVVLAFPDFTQQFIVRTDASNVGLGAILSQKINGVERPLAFASRSLSPAERNYETSERECCGILFALKKFEHYIDGQEFILATDNGALTWLNKFKSQNSKLMRWALRIQDFQPTIIHCPGKQNVVADALSRDPVDSGEFEDVDENRRNLDFQLNCSTPSLFLALTQEITLDQLKAEQAKDNEVQALLTDLPQDFKVIHNILYRINKYGGKLPFIPVSLRQRVLQYFHDRPDAGHMGYRKTLYRILRRVFWFKMHEDIYTFIQSCEVCQKTKNPNTRAVGHLQSVETRGPWDMLALDLVGPLPMTQRQNTFLLVVTDHFTKWVEIFAIRKATATVIAYKVESEVFARWGRPSAILTDNGSQFKSKLFKTLCETWNIKQKFTTCYHPQSNITERVNRSLIAILRAYSDRKHTKWDVDLHYVAMALRTAVSDTTGFSPSMLNFGREIKTPFDVTFADESCPEFENWVDHKRKLIEKLSGVYALARRNIEKAHESQARNYNKNKRVFSYNVGDLVLLRTHFKSDKEKRFTKKFAFKWEGPFRINRVFSNLVYGLCDFESGEFAGKHSVKDIKPYFTRPERECNESEIVKEKKVQIPLVQKKNVISQISIPVPRYNLRPRKETVVQSV